ncbi:MULTISPECIES: PP2C family protein-serine/threonine phosphatase [unclassified Streptomyces]|uniref:PP2C family protein-serine/threonine phosphatase n=1 Tax=unclassified Streptomyces TaxID=2593676 RepID=UPI0021ACEB71|nr:PP2C family protein-serine/threonine phosphatase [Streptomyces sp. PsTaAH-137]
MRQEAKGTTRYAVVRALPTIMIAAATVTDTFTPGRERYDAFLYVVPGLAAVSWGVAATLVFGAAATLVILLLEAERGVAFMPGGLAVIVLMLVISAVAAWSSAVRLSRERELRHARQVADVVQRAVQHPLPERLGPLDLHLLYETPVAGAHMSGDFYKALKVPGAVRMMIGDVQGHGLGAVESATVLLGSFREYAYTEPDLPAIARRLETAMERHTARADVRDADRFATVLLAEIPLDRPVLRLLSCGHPPPVLQPRCGPARPVAFRRVSLPVHLDLGMTDEYVVEEVPFGMGDRILMYTDGVSETRDAAGDFYPVADRLACWQDTPDRKVLPALAEDLRRYSGHGPDDDTAAVLAVRTSPPE